jgi:L-fuculose-phosphate aldolase
MGKADKHESAQVADTSRRLYREGLLTGTSGNVSALDAKGRIWITPSGRPWKSIRSASIAKIEADGSFPESPEPSSELPLHKAIYAARSDVRGIVHTHSRFATVFSVLRREIDPVHYLLAVAGGRIRVAEYAGFGTDALATAAVAALGTDKAVLLANHGLVAVGPTLRDAERVAVAVEEVAALAWHAAMIGKPVALSAAQMAEAAERFATYGRRM